MVNFVYTGKPIHPGGNLRANLNSTSNRCHLREVAFEWQLTEGAIYLPMGCHQGGLAELKTVRVVRASNRSNRSCRSFRIFALPTFVQTPDARRNFSEIVLTPEARRRSRQLQAWSSPTLPCASRFLSCTKTNMVRMRCLCQQCLGCGKAAYRGTSLVRNIHTPRISETPTPLESP